MLTKILKLGQILIGLLYKNYILSGPFHGLKISKDYIGSSYLPKILGTYEIEIATHLKRAFQTSDVFIDIGCAGGYYLQLASQINPQIELQGIDVNKKAIDHVNRLLPNVKLYLKEFDFDSVVELDQMIKGRKAVVLIDIEGYEWSFIEGLIHQFKNRSELTLVVELHNHDKRAFELSKEILDVVEIIDYRFKEKVPFSKMLTENEFRENSTQYLICKGNELY